jgi:hypothetical protein
MITEKELSFQKSQNLGLATFFFKSAGFSQLIYISDFIVREDLFSNF